MTDPLVEGLRCHLVSDLFAGPPVRWDFVSSRKERIEQAKEDWKQGRILLPPNDNDVFIPLPDDRSRPAGNPAPPALS